MEHFVDSTIESMSIIKPEWRPTVKSAAMATLSWADWACGAQDLTTFVTNHYSLAIAELIFLSLAILPMWHALIHHRGRYLYLLVAVYAFGVYWENTRIRIVDTNYQFHAQSLLTWFGRRVPVYVIFGMHPVQMYTACVIAKSARLDTLSQSLLAGGLTALIAFPFDVVGTQQLFWTWHQSDPRIADRVLGVPCFHILYRCMSVAAFVYVLEILRQLMKKETYAWKSFVTELAIHVMAILSAPNAALLTCQLMTDYLHHSFDISYRTSVRLILDCGVMMTVGLKFWFSRRGTHVQGVRYRGVTRPIGPIVELLIALLLHAQMVVILLMFMDAKDVTATSIFQPIGKCSVEEDLSQFPYVTKKENFVRNKFLCLSTLNETYYDFDCLKKKDRPTTPTGDRTIEWYAICGVDVVDDGNVQEMVIFYILLLAAIVALLCKFGYGIPLDDTMLANQHAADGNPTNHSPSRVRATNQLPLLPDISMTTTDEEYSSEEEEAERGEQLRCSSCTEIKKEMEELKKKMKETRAKIRALEGKEEGNRIVC